MKISWTGGSKEVIVNDSSSRNRSIMGGNNVTLNFSLSEYIEFALGSTIDYEGLTYTLNTPLSIKEVNSTNFEYTLIFGSDQETLANLKLKDIDGNLKFPFTAKPLDHLQLIVNVLNTNGSGWSIGNYVDVTEKLISYNHTNCMEALHMIANAFDTEFEIVGKVIHLRKVEYNLASPLALSYGKGNGFISGVGRKNDSQKSGFNVLYVQGGSRNIDFSKYGSKTLLLPKSQSYTYLGNIYEIDVSGLNIQRQGSVILNRKEESLDSSHIFPQRVGTVSAVIVVDASKNFYDFIDSSIPADLDFSTLRMDGERMTVKFESGKLAGREFDIEQSDTVISGYIHAERRFVLVPKEEDGFTMPNATFIPAVGDKYSVYGMMMPTAYISDNATKTGASWDMFKEAAKYFYENEESKFTFKGELDGIWSKKDWLNIGGKIVVGGYVLFSDTKFQPTGIRIRIISIKDYLNNTYSPIIELANSVQGESIVSELDNIKQNEVVIEHGTHEYKDFVRRYFRDAKETIKLLEAADLNFDSSINPLTVKTMSLLVGDESLQFRFVNGSLNEIVETFAFNTGTKIFTAGAGTIQHLTLGVNAVMPSPTYKTWTVPAFSTPALADGTKSYYLYIKASTTLTTAIFYLSETAIGLNDVSGYYHLLTCIINTEYQGDRSYVRMYGFTEILPGQIRTTKLSSTDGTQFIELLSNSINIVGRVTFSSDSPALLAQTAAVNIVQDQVTILTTKTNFLNDTLISGNIIATGTLAVGNGSGANAFISGVETGVTAIRFLAGSNWANRATAPFRILDDGSLFASKGTIAGWVISADEISKGRLHLNATKNTLELFNNFNQEVMRIDDSIDSDSYGSALGGSKATNPTNGHVSYMSGNGLFSNAGGTRFFTSASGINSAASIVGLLVTVLIGSGDYSSAVAGINQTGDKRGLGGYFYNGLLVEGAVRGLEIKSRLIKNIKTITANYTVAGDDLIFSCYNTVSITITLPPTPEIGRSIEVRRNNASSVSLSGNGNQILQQTAVNLVSVGAGQGDKAIVIWDGSYWLYNYMIR